MSNEKNLNPVRTKEEARERGHNGGIKSGEVRREKKAIKEIVNCMLDECVPDNEQLKEIREAGLIINDTLTYKECIVAAAIIKTANKGRIDDLIKLADIIGEPVGEDAFPYVPL